EPPVTEELAVERDREQRVPAVGASTGKLIADDLHEVPRMVARALRRAVRRVLLLLSEAFVHRGHTPVAEAARRVLAMELAVLRISGITGEGRPDLTRHALVPRDRDDIGIADVVRTKQIDVARCCGRGHDLCPFLMRRPSTELALTATARAVTGGARMSRQGRGGRGEGRAGVVRGALLAAGGGRS